jgi:hypothetical protein
MRENIVMIKNQDDEKNKLNNSQDLQINRGFELMLRHNSRREKPSEPKTFQIRFGKMLSLFKREIHFQFEFFLDMKKSNSQEK